MNSIFRWSNAALRERQLQKIWSPVESSEEKHGSMYALHRWMERMRTSRDKIYGNNAEHNSQMGYVNERSICPWTMEEDFESNRYPTVFRYAKCGCTTCQGLGSNFECVPVLQTRLVMRRKRVKNNISLIPEHIELPVACTCVRLHLQNTYGFKLYKRNVDNKGQAEFNSTRQQIGG